MKHSSSLIAKALAQAIIETPKGKQEGFEKRFKTLIKAHGLQNSEKQILNETERILMEHDGIRDIVVETPRPLGKSHEESVRKSFVTKDRLRFEVKPELVAGMKIIVNGNEILDNTLQRKLKNLFSV